MTEISVVVPLSAISGAGKLSPDEIVVTLQNSVKFKHEAEVAESKLDSLKKILVTSGRSLQLILDEVTDPYDKAQALRKLAKEMQDIASEF